MKSILHLLGPALGAGLALTFAPACTRGPDAGPAAERVPDPVVRTASTAAFRLVRPGRRPTFARGELHVFVNPDARDSDSGLPGIALGDVKGPRYGLLGGFYAPTMLTPDSAKSYRVEVDSTARSLRIRFLADGVVPALDVEVLANLQVVLHGEAALAFFADRSQLRGDHQGRPSFSTTVEAGSPGRINQPRADRLDVLSPKGGAYSLQTSCPRPRVVRPAAEGATSVFVVYVGRHELPEAPLYMPPRPPPHPDLAQCPPSVTSTLTRAPS